MNFLKSSKRRPQFEILEAKQLLAADVLTSVAGGSETENLTAIHAEEPLLTGAPVRSGLNRLEHGPGLHDSVHCLTRITLSTGRSNSNPTPHPMPVPELVDACHKDSLDPGPIGLDPGPITTRLVTGRAGSNRLEHGPGLHD